jgi:uncharacterized protein YdhG (YjbR/CyaY superfamily)
MAARKQPKKGQEKPAKLFSKEEMAAMRDAVRERTARRRGSKVDGETEVRQKIAEMPPPDRAIAERFHALVKATAPSLTCKTWYGMPAYVRGDDVVCFLQPASKFKVRYATIGFSDEAKLDEGRLWPVTYAITEMGAAEEARLVALLKKALG